MCCFVSFRLLRLVVCLVGCLFDCSASFGLFCFVRFVLFRWFCFISLFFFFGQMIFYFTFYFQSSIYMAETDDESDMPHTPSKFVLIFFKF